MLTDPKSLRVLGSRLVEARQLRGITLEVAAGQLGMSRQTLSAIEEGSRPARPGEIVQLAGLYGCPVHWLTRAAGPVADSQSPAPAVEARRELPSTTDRPASAAVDPSRLLAVQAYDRGDLTEKELANSLGCDIWETRQLVKDLLQGEEMKTHDQIGLLITRSNVHSLLDPA